MMVVGTETRCSVTRLLAVTPALRWGPPERIGLPGYIATAGEFAKTWMINGHRSTRFPRVEPCRVPTVLRAVKPSGFLQGCKFCGIVHDKRIRLAGDAHPWRHVDQGSVQEPVLEDIRPADAAIGMTAESWLYRGSTLTTTFPCSICSSHLILKSIIRESSSIRPRSTKASERGFRKLSRSRLRFT